MIHQSHLLSQGTLALFSQITVTTRNSTAMIPRGRVPKTQITPFGSQIREGIDSQVKFLQQCPQIPVGGRLRFFLNSWKEITNDQWVLSVIAEGYKQEFMREPPQTGVKETSAPKNSLNILNAEVEELLRKDAIETVPMNEIQAGFYSTFFLVPKKNGKMPLIRYLQKNHFKLDTMSKVLILVKPKDWAISLGLTEVYLHIPLFPKHRKYLRFCIAGQCYQWKCLCFGPTSAPRVFKKWYQ